MPKTPTSKKNETITIPMHLARLLAAEPGDIIEGHSYEDVQKLAKSMLRMLMEL